MRKNLVELVEMWVIENAGDMTSEQMNGTHFVLGNQVVALHMTDEGYEIVNLERSRVIVFRDVLDLQDELVCRICGTVHVNNVEAVRCCSDEE